MTTAEAVALGSADSAEELERAELYGLLARCWQAPPDEALLAGFAAAATEAPQPGSFLEAPWQALVAAMRAAERRRAPPTSTPRCSSASASPRCSCTARTTSPA